MGTIYKVGGSVIGDSDARILIINEADWSVEKNVLASGIGVYDETVTSGSKTIISRDDQGKIEGFGSVVPVSYSVSGWESKFDNNYWEGWYGDAGDTKWLGAAWESAEWYYEIHLKAIGSWATGYRPTKIKMTLSKDISGPSSVIVRDASLNVIGNSGSGYISGTEINLSFASAGNIYELYIPTGDDSTTCTSITFYA
jgi:hypothetical protein